MTIPASPPVGALLGANLTLPCLVSLSHPPPAPVTNGRHAVLSLPRVKWSLLVDDEETEILVARGDRVRVSEAYQDRASLLSYARSPADLTLHLQGLRRSDSGLYRCEVQQGLEDASDVALVKVKGPSEHHHHHRWRFWFQEMLVLLGSLALVLHRGGVPSPRCGPTFRLHLPAGRSGLPGRRGSDGVSRAPPGGRPRRLHPVRRRLAVGRLRQVIQRSSRLLKVEVVQP